MATRRPLGLTGNTTPPLLRGGWRARAREAARRGGCACVCALMALAPGCAAGEAYRRSDERGGTTGAAPTGQGDTAGRPDRVTEVLVDRRGIPHIFGETLHDVVFGLGFMHGRDRAPQLAVLRLAGSGRLAEAFGPEYLGIDRQLRLALVGIEDELGQLDAEDRALLHVYVEGLHRGMKATPRALWAGPRALHPGSIDDTALSAHDILCIARVQAWLASDNLRSELARLHVAARLPDDDPRRALLLATVPAEDAATLAPAALRPLPAPRGPSLPPPRWDDVAPEGARSAARAASAGGRVPSPPARIAWAAERPPPVPLLGWPDGLPGQGHSSAWVIHGSLRTGGAPLLVNDPHGPHGDLSQFYLAHLETPQWSAIGATLPGIPVVRIAATRHLAYGLTAARVDTQDLIPVEPTSRLTTLEQEFRVRGRFPVHETWYRSEVGPLIPPDWLPARDRNQRLALSWSGFHAERHRRPFTPWFRLAQARTLDEADVALQDIASPTQSMVLIAREGDIAYRLVGLTPRRTSPSLPWDASAPDGRAGEFFLEEAEKPRADNPASGYLVTSNQRILEETDPLSDALGSDADLPYRAQRIHERLRELLRHHQSDARSLSDVQHDVISVQARALAPILGAHCPDQIPPHDEVLRAAFCDALRRFDGAYREDSPGALPFTLLHEELMYLVIESHLGPELWPMLAREAFVEGALDSAIRAEAGGRSSPLLDLPRTRAREGLGGMVALASGKALTRLLTEYGATPSDWRWARARAQAQAGAPRGSSWPPASRLPAPTLAPRGGGSRHAPRAESDPAPGRGAVLRFMAEGGAQMRAAAALDRGQGGAGITPADDAMRAWTAGELPPLAASRSEAEEDLQERFWLTR